MTVWTELCLVPSTQHSQAWRRSRQQSRPGGTQYSRSAAGPQLPDKQGPDTGQAPHKHLGTEWTRGKHELTPLPEAQGQQGITRATCLSCGTDNPGRKMLSQESRANTRLSGRPISTGNSPWGLRQALQSVGAPSVPFKLPKEVLSPTSHTLGKGWPWQAP